MLEMTRTGPEWKDKIITGDETWVYGYDPETKRQSAEWRGQGMAMRPLSKLDSAYRSILLSKFFGRGWGKPDHIKKLLKYRVFFADRHKSPQLLDHECSFQIKKVESTMEHVLYEGQFVSPLAHLMPDVLPPESHLAHFQILQPARPPHGKLRPLCLHLAGTGDHLISKNTCQPSFILTPAVMVSEQSSFRSMTEKSDQRSSLHNVSDIFVMGGSLCLESQVLLSWAERNGFGPLAVSGLSMGGHMASIAAGHWHKPLALAPCLSWTTASTVFTQGVMSAAVPWRLLEDQLKKVPAYLEDILPSFTYPYKESAEPADTAAPCTARQFMRLIMDEFTHLAGFARPVDPAMAVLVAALHDAYVPPNPSIEPLDQLWAGSELRRLDCGHVAAFILNQAEFRKAILDALEKTARSYYGDTMLPQTPLNNQLTT
ncbi:C4orf29 [Cordylochernes scorpioides]|uniref:C4orf29 n=1 Tax=Cordylochernes scorpioides TaxID=51811 RepID=A0ABY6K4U6_9ARAC|nr:C4orf29 [Cordylochernes scorpioides]